ncbi:MAG TPA: AsmA family protein [Sphingobium sp.]|nr:AsmA family protein [Sphingobium sp.]
MAHDLARSAPAVPSAPSPAKRRFWLRAAIATPILIWIALYAGAAQPLRGLVAKRASAALDREVTIGGPLRVLVTPFSITLTAGDVRVANPRWAMDDALLIARQATVRLATFDLLIGRSGIRGLDVRGGTLDLERSRHAGRVNWALGKPGTLFDPAALRQIDADDLTVRYRDFGTGTDMRLIASTAGRGSVAFAGQGTAGERAFTLEGEARSGAEQPTRIAIAARTGGVVLRLAGEAPGPLQLARARLTVGASGADFAELAALAGIGLPAMPGYALKAQLNHMPRGWHFARIEGRIGGTDLTGKLTLDRRRARPRVVAHLSSRTLDAADGMALLGLRHDAMPIDMPEAGLDLDARLLPDATITPAALRRFDAVVTYTAERVTGTRHAAAHLSATLALVNGVLTLSPASVDLAGGFVSSDIVVDTRRAPALVRSDIRLSPTPMGQLLAGWGIAPTGTDATARGRLQLTGRGNSLREMLATAHGRMALVIPEGTVRTQRASLSGLDVANLNAALFNAPPFGAAQVNCGLIAFTVRDGIATADPILIDTDGNTLSGKGHIDLRTGTVDLRLAADGKRFAFHGQPARVRVTGPLADPLVSREPVAWFYPTDLFGLRLSLPRLGALFSFIDPGDAPDMACGPILRGEPAAAQRESSNELADLR